MRYQYSFFRQRVDSFFEYVEESPSPNMFFLDIEGKITKQEFRDFCEALRDRVELTSEQLEIKSRIRTMGAAW
jgi:hypothetical protein